MDKKLVEKIDWEKIDGLVPAIIQDVNTNQVLMLGFMNKAALLKTLEFQKVVFYSRTKKRLWMKGESSGNILNVVTMSLDCDNDTLLVKAHPKGPTCHLGKTSCFDKVDNSNGAITGDFNVLTHLQATIQSRFDKRPKDSYITSLIESGVARMAQKVGEEGVEVAIAAMKKDSDAKTELTEESADLLFHLMILLKAQDLSLDDVLSVLQKRVR